jgi:cytochrome bd-type quinol oxidase subunit 2
MPDGSQPIRSRTTARVALWLLFLAALTIGLPAAFDPHYFYSDFPLDLHWVEMLPPYNEHLTTDVGGLYLGFALLFAWAARTLQQTLARAASCAWLLVATLHLAFHATHLDGFGAADAIGELGSLGLLLALPLAALWAVAEPRPVRSVDGGER